MLAVFHGIHASTAGMVYCGSGSTCTLSHARSGGNDGFREAPKILVQGECVDTSRQGFLVGGAAQTSETAVLKSGQTVEEPSSVMPMMLLPKQPIGDGPPGMNPSGPDAIIGPITGAIAGAISGNSTSPAAGVARSALKAAAEASAATGPRPDNMAA